MLPRTGLPSLPFLQHALLTHWSLCGRAGRPWALAATVADVEAFLLGKPGIAGRLWPAPFGVPVCLCVCVCVVLFSLKSVLVVVCSVLPVKDRDVDRHHLAAHELASIVYPATGS